MKILFQGDSITDCGREDYGDLRSLGNGYPKKIAQYLEIFHAGEHTVYNGGISGNRTTDLLERWERDCLALEPDVLTILIGINDCWRRYDRNLPMTADEYEGNYRELMRRVRERLPGTRVILMEPFLIPADPEKECWHEDFDPKKLAAKKIAREFETDYLPLDGIFAAACAKRPPAYWAADGVHPTDAGHALIARQWLSLMGL